MKLRVAALAAAGVLGASAFAAAGVAGPEYKNKYESTTASRDCGDGDTVVYGGPLKMWPPNHKLQSASVVATEGDDDAGSDAVELGLVDNAATFAGEKGSGGPNHDPDSSYPNGPAAVGEDTATVDLQLRAERSGQDRDGREYVIHWEAVFDNGEKTCTSMDEGQTPFTVTVPHDMRGGADWK